MRDHRDFHQIVVTVNFCKSLIIYDVDATLSLLNKKKRCFNLSFYQQRRNL